MGILRRILLLFLVAGLFSFCPASFISADQRVHPVRSGETLWSISRLYDISVKKLARANHLHNPRHLQVGQKLVIPLSNPKAPLRWNYKYESTTLRKLLRTSAKKKRWKYVVVHHSATPNGGARAFDHFHRNKRHMKNGLAYHFVIGNGNGAQDGKVEVGGRWKKQLPGGHCSNQKMNEIGIGICLVGNFEKTRPTRRQMESLVTLVKHLQEEFGIPDKRVILHKEVKQKSTLCPGKRFPAKQFHRML